MITESPSFAIHSTRQELLDRGKTTDRGEWQAIREDRPQTRVYEVNDVSFRVNVPEDIDVWAEEVEPNLPWAEDHFKERISGDPLNPGEQYKNWPWYEQGVEEHKETGKFSHTYMERFWPSQAAPVPIGVRFEYGDLVDLIDLLNERPFTRQAYLPIWFPEDLTASRQGERVPCTLGYHLIASPSLGKPALRMVYFMRSCDFFRYLRDDMYMAGRLLQTVANETGMAPTTLTMHISNLHIFDAEYERLRREHEEEVQRRLHGAF